MDHKNVDDNQIFVYIEQTLTYPILDTKWLPKTAKFISLGFRSNGLGALKIFELNENKIDLVREISQKCGFRCGSFGGSTQESHLAVGDFEGKLQILDIERIDGCVYSTKAHEAGVNCIDTLGGLTSNCGPPEILTGGRDGSIQVWDSRQRDIPVIDIRLKYAEHGSRDCWSVAFGNAFNNQERCVSAGFDNGEIKLFDLRQLKTVWEKSISHGVSCIAFNKANSRIKSIAASTVQGSLHVFNVDPNNTKKFNEIIETTGTSNIWCVRHVPQKDNLFATCSGNGQLRIWSRKPNNKLSQLQSTWSRLGAGSGPLTIKITRRSTDGMLERISD